MKAVDESFFSSCAKRTTNFCSTQKFINSNVHDKRFRTKAECFSFNVENVREESEITCTASIPLAGKMFFSCLQITPNLILTTCLALLKIKTPFGACKRAFYPSLIMPFIHDDFSLATLTKPILSAYSLIPLALLILHGCN